jgi:chromosome segregation ATPase
MKDELIQAVKEALLPELKLLTQEVAEVKNTQALTNKRLDDLNAHLVDQSRRIDAVREELSARINSVEDKLTARIDAVRAELGGRIDKLDGRLDKLSSRLDTLHADLVGRNDAVRGELARRFDALSAEFARRYDDANKRLDGLFGVLIPKEEYYDLSSRMRALERDVEELKRRVAA